MEFKNFLEQTAEERKNIRYTINKLPKRYRRLLVGFKIKFVKGSTLKNDKKHVGYVDTDKKEIVICAPYHYPAEHTFLHEIGHLVWEKTLTDKQKAKWKKVVDNTKDPRQYQGYEELFCHCFGAFYSKNKISIHSHQCWFDFIREINK